VIVVHEFASRDERFMPAPAGKEAWCKQASKLALRAYEQSGREAFLIGRLAWPGYLGVVLPNPYPKRSMFFILAIDSLMQECVPLVGVAAFPPHPMMDSSKVLVGIFACARRTEHSFVHIAADILDPSGLLQKEFPEPVLFDD
jgi:hypothetical protein